MDKRYSVLMSVYYKERADWLDLSIKSMFDQTVKPSEFVLVEDGKLTDELYAVIEKYKNNYPGVFRTVALPENVGLGLALRKGVEECRYELVARMDSDDYSTPERIEKELLIFENNPDIGMVGTNVSEFIGSFDNVISNVILPEFHDDIVFFSKKRNPFRHPALVFKKSEVLKAGNYRDYHLCEDYDLCIRMIRSGCKCHNISDICVFVRISEDFYKRRGGKDYFKSIKKFKKEQLENGYFSKFDYLKTIVPHAIVCYMPNYLRSFVYKKFLRG